MNSNSRAANATASPLFSNQQSLQGPTKVETSGIADSPPISPVWPVPGHTSINRADKPGEGDGHYNTCRGGGCRRRHEGLDIQAPNGSQVVAFRSGTVVDIRPNPSGTYGNQVVLDHGDGIYSQYGHLQSTTVVPGQSVGAGDEIGFVGQTGNSPRTGDAHLHFEIRRESALPRAAGGTTENPEDYLPNQ